MRRFVPPVPRNASFVRLLCGTVVACGMALTTISAQIPGRNVNMVAGNTWPDGDPYLQRQNEPSIGASTRNPLHLLAGSNDYRTVDLPGLAEDETGGLFAFWLRDGKTPPNAPVVHLGSEGEVRVLASSEGDFLSLLGADALGGLPEQVV